MIDKRDVEKTLIKALETEGHFVERNIEFLPDRPLLDNEFSTVYLLNHNTGEFETLDAGHILGCDGETSTVQKRAVISHQYLKVDENSGDGEYDVWTVAHVETKTNLPDFRRRCRIGS